MSQEPIRKRTTPSKRSRRASDEEQEEPEPKDDAGSVVPPDDDDDDDHDSLPPPAPKRARVTSQGNDQDDRSISQVAENSPLVVTPSPQPASASTSQESPAMVSPVSSVDSSVGLHRSGFLSSSADEGLAVGFHEDRQHGILGPADQEHLSRKFRLWELVFNEQQQGYLMKIINMLFAIENSGAAMTVKIKPPNQVTMTPLNTQITFFFVAPMTTSYSFQALLAAKIRTYCPQIHSEFTKLRINIKNLKGLDTTRATRRDYHTLVMTRYSNNDDLICSWYSGRNSIPDETTTIPLQMDSDEPAANVTTTDDPDEFPFPAGEQFNYHLWLTVGTLKDGIQNSYALSSKSLSLGIHHYRFPELPSRPSTATSSQTNNKSPAEITLYSQHSLDPEFRQSKCLYYGLKEIPNSDDPSHLKVVGINELDEAGQRVPDISKFRSLFSSSFYPGYLVWLRTAINLGERKIKMSLGLRDPEKHPDGRSGPLLITIYFDDDSNNNLRPEEMSVAQYFLGCKEVETDVPEGLPKVPEDQNEDQ